MPELKISVAAFNEIAQALQLTGKQLEAGAPITLTKDDKIVNPIDYRLATMRRDCAEICSKVYNASHMDKGINFLEFCQRTYNFVLMNDITEPDTDKPKVNTPSVWK